MSATVLRFSENFDTMTVPECLAFIERSRRQIDRMERLVPRPRKLDLQELASIREGLGALERRVRSYPTNN